MDAASGDQISQPCFPSPPLPIPAAPVTVSTEKGRPTSLKGVPHKSIGSSSSNLDAFTYLMKNAAKQQASKSQDKGKGKAASSLPKTSDVDVVNTKGKERGSEVKKPSLKDRMRRKGKQEPVAPAKFIPVVFDEDEEEQVEPEEQEFKAKTSPVLEPVVPTLEGKPSLLGGITQEGSQELLPVIPDEPSAAGPSTPQELEAEPLPGNKVSPESVPEPQLPSPVVFSPETEPDMAENSASIQEFIPFTPAISEGAVVQEQHGHAASPLMAVKPRAGDDVIQAEVNLPTAVDVATEPQATEQPLLTPQTTEIPIKQPVQPPKPKPAPRKRGQSSIPTSTRVTRSTLRPPVPPVVKPTATRRECRVSLVSQCVC